MRIIFSAIIFICIISACQQRIPDKLITITGLTMGTTYSVKFKVSGNELDKNKIHTDLEQILSDINQSMSTYINDSELSRFNRSRDNHPQVLSDDLYRVIAHANHVSIISNGAFDVTVGALVNLWGFGPDPLDHEIPANNAIDAIKRHIGFDKLVFDDHNKSIAKTDPAIYVDLSGIAKGFAVDKLADYLDSLMVTNYLVEIGGELTGKGFNPENKPWQIGIEQAKPLERAVQRIIRLNNIAMATSGDYRNYFEQDGVRYSHTINPVSGKPIKHNLASVTVIDKSTMHADAMATAFMVLGPDKTIDLANKLNMPVYMIIKTENGFDERYNDSFKPYLSD